MCKKLKKILIILACLSILGLAIPMLILSVTEKTWSADQQIFSHFAIMQTNQLLNPVERRLQIDLHVTAIELDPTRSNCPAAQTDLAYEAQVHAYTIFGLPYTSFTVHCDGVKRDS